MKISKQLQGAAIAGITLALSTGALAATGGGATIHNAATLSYNGGQQVTSSTNVSVLTIAAAPTIIVTSSTAVTANPSDLVPVTYTITNTANGYDGFGLTPGSSDAGVSAPGLALSNAGGPITSVSLGASVTSAASGNGVIYLPAGSETGIAAGDTLIINGNAYQVLAGGVVPGAPASTTGNTTTAEVPTSIALAPLAGSPPIIANSVLAGTQVGERQTFTLTATAGIPATPGVDGTSGVYVSGTTSAQDTAGNPVTFTTQGGPQQVTITVKSGSVQIVKEARNVTKGGAFATSGVTAQSGDTIEYRITGTAIAPYGNATGASLVDELPPYTTYVAGSTTLNGGAVTDDSGAGVTTFPLDSIASTGSALDDGIVVNSAAAAAGTIVEGASAVVIYQVTVQ